MKPTCVFSLLFLLAVGGCSEQRSTESPAKPVSTIVVGESASYSRRTVTGVIQSADTTQLNFEVAGVVAEVLVELGDSFERGQALARLEQIDYRLAVQEREGQLSESRARLVEAENDFERKRELVATGAISQSAFDVARSKFRTAADQVAIAQTRLNMAREDLEDTTLEAPYPGTVARRLIEPSQSIGPDRPAFTIQGNNGLEVSLLVPETMLALLDPGMSARIDIPATGTTTTARVQEIGTAAQSASSFPVVLRVEGPESESLLPGMSAEVTFDLPVSDAMPEGFRLPIHALLAGERDTHHIFKLIADGSASRGAGDGDPPTGPAPDTYRARQVPVEVVQLFDQHAIVSGDLESGDRIVDAGIAFLRDGQAVVPIESGVARYNP